MYLFLFALAATIPAGVTSYLAVQKADQIQQQADAEAIARVRAELLREIDHLGEELLNIAANLAGWDETRTLFADSTYYNYWKETRIKDIAQYKGLVDAVDLYDAQGFALTDDYTLSSTVYKQAVNGPAVLQQYGGTWLVYFHPVELDSESGAQRLGYVGIRLDLERAVAQLQSHDYSLLEGIDWHLGDGELQPLHKAVQTATLDITAIPEIREFADIIRQGFSEYFVYALVLVGLLVVLLLFSIAWPLQHLARYLQAIYAGQAQTIPEKVHGLVRIRELENVRQAINDYKHRFQSAAQTLEQRNKELLQLTYHDPLTGCFNRRAFEARLEHAIETALIEEREHALCYIDLDQFKVVNDTCGHMAGDQLLKQIAILLQSEIRETDMLARLGGDEFGVLLEGCGVDKASEMAEAMRLKIKTHRFVWQNKPLDIGVSIGLVPIRADNANLGEILKNADAACYVAKDAGRNRLQIYREHDEELAQRYGEMQWVSRIKEALEQDRFILYAQRIQAVAYDDKQTHYELLIRLREDEQLIAPMAYIPAAERYNLMPDIDCWVIRTALSMLRELDAQTRRGLVLSINLSGQSVGNAEVLELIKSEIAANEVEAGQLCFEITETAAISNLSTAIGFIHSLRELGCKFSLDDFGSGLSSFGYLSNLEVDFIKIDGEFIKSIETSELSLSIVSAINRIGHVMGVRTIAEFVESPSLLESIQSVGIDYVQGFAVHRPAPLHEVLKPGPGDKAGPG